MKSYKIDVRAVDKITHDVYKITTTKPAGYSYIPGQATELAINKTQWSDEKRPFTFTSLPTDSHLEFIIKKLSFT